MPTLAVERGVEAGPALIREIRDELPPRRIGLVWRADRVPSQALEAFVDAAREVVGGRRSPRRCANCASAGRGPRAAG